MTKSPGSLDDDGKRLLSKVVRFVKSPTTHWADLDRPAPASSSPSTQDSQSKLALKERIERKRRNDFVRDREFDMLRKLRRKDMLKDAAKPPGQTPPYPNSTPPPPGGPAQTLKKINEIETQMANAWFRRKSSDAQQTAASAPPSLAAPASVPAPQPTLPDPVAAPSQPAPAPAFAPTEPMDYAAFEAAPARPRPPAAPAPAPERQENTIEWTEAPSPPAANAFGGLGSFQIEVLAQTKTDPAIEEAAIRFANGDVAGAEAGLCDLVASGGHREDDVYSWLTLFDLYRATDEQDKFDGIALHFAARFGRSAPQWGVDAGASSRPAPVAAATAVSSARFHWGSPPAVSMQSVATLNATLARNAAPWRLDWRRLKTIEPAALPALNEAFQRWAKEPAQLQMLGVEALLHVLAEHSPTDDRQSDPLWWQARLALLRVLGEMEEFELVALNYCVTYEISPPAWETPKNSYRPLTDKGEPSAPDQPARPAAPAQPVPSYRATDFGVTDLAALPEDGVARAELAGELLESADGALNRAQLTAGAARSIEFNCRNLRRVDFGAAGDLLNWSIAQKNAGRQVGFKQVNRLVATFFGVIGITDAARVVLRTD